MRPGHPCRSMGATLLFAADLFTAFLLISTLACTDPPTPAEEVHSLIAALPGAEERVEPRLLDLGAGASEPLLIEGFSYSETAEDGTTFAWSDRAASALHLYVAQPRPLRVRLRLLPLPAPGQPPQAIEPFLNGAAIGGERELAEGWNEITLELPLDRQVAGDNRFELRYRWTREPSPGARRQSLGVAWDWLRLESIGGDGGTALTQEHGPSAQDIDVPQADDNRLILPPASRLDFFLSLPAGAHLAFDRLAVRGGGTLIVEIEERGGTLRPVARLASQPQEGSVDLGVAQPGLARLRLRAPTEAGAVLEAPTITAPASSSTPAPSEPSPTSTPAPAGAAALNPRPNLLIYLVDTLRADRLGVYGYARPTSPRLDAFARDALLFERAFAQSSWTKASVASIFAGVWPRVHGLHDPADAFSAALPTLPELLRDAGYDTAAVTTNAYISPEAGFARGVNHFVYLPREPNRSTNVYRKAAEWLDARQAPSLDGPRADTPFFLYLHTIDPHAPYAPPGVDKERFAPAVPLDYGSVPTLRAMMEGRKPLTPEILAGIEDLYDGEIAFNDRQFGRLLDDLKARGLYDNTLIVFVSDHGEAFDEHGRLGHGWDLFRETLQVPLLIKPPQGGASPAAAGRRVTASAQHLDLLPTLLAAAGVDTPSGLAGTNLLALADESSAPLSKRREVFSFLRYSGRTGASLVAGDWHLSEPLTHAFGKAPTLFDLRQDPGEGHDLLAEEPVLAGYLRSRIRAELAASADGFDPQQFEVDAETRKQLRALGYVD